MSALTDLFTAMANKIRSNVGGSQTYTPLQMVNAIDDVYDAGVASVAKSKSGTINRTTSSDNYVECGFRPRKIMLIKGSDSGTVSTGEVRMMYDADWSTSYMVNDYKSSSAAAMTKPSITSYITLTNDGFTVAAPSSSTYAGTYYYTALE